MTGPVIDRRSLLASGGALTLGGCVHCQFPDVSTDAKRVGDAHAHFFNVADLPVAGFAKFVLIPRHFPDLPDFALALVDIIAFIAKFLALSADEEARQLGAGTLGSRGVPNPQDFGRKAAKAHRIGLRDEAPVKQVDRVGFGEEEPVALRADVRASSHRALAELLGGTAPGKGAGRAMLDEADFASIASGEAVTLAGHEPDPDLQCPAGGMAAGAESRLPSARNLLYWAYLMCRSRCAHVEEYLKSIHATGTSVDVAVNLLIDYDKWLDDTPAKGSNTAQQVAYWTRYSAASATVGGRLELHTFAGYDPLRDAEERVLEQAAETSFQTMQRWASNGRDAASPAQRKIAGFKVYPPMGFRPDTNRGISIPEVRGGKAIKGRWKSEFHRIGDELDHSLDAFFKFCVEENFPVMTHARESNIAFPNSGGNVYPEHWLHRVQALATIYQGTRFKPLRLCLGHFDMKSCPTTMTDKQVLVAALKLNKDKKARVYFDLSFDDRILAGGGKQLFTELAEACIEAEEDGDYLMFGSDWIMLANQPKVSQYLDKAQAAARSVKFWECRMDKLFGGNLKRYLDPDAM